MDGGQVKLCDFGISKLIENDTEQVKLDEALINIDYTQTIGTAPWMAPEFISEKKISTKTDVYAFGIFMWEILTEKQPYPD